VQADGEHVFEDVGWRLNVEDVCLDRPWSEALRFDAFLDGDGHVLMPGNFPVGAGDFVEEDAADGDRMFSRRAKPFSSTSSCKFAGLGTFLF